MARLRRSFLIIGLISALSHLSRASQYRYDSWTADVGGLPQNIIRGLVQTPDGYLWIATLDGIARFDGVHFTVFNKTNMPGIESNRINAMLPGENGDLLLLNENSSITRYHGGKFHTYSSAEGLPVSGLYSIAGDAAGHIWFLVDGSIMHWNEQHSGLIDLSPDDRRMRYEPLNWDNAGFWGRDAKGLHIFYKGRFIDYPLPVWLRHSRFWGVGVEQNGAVWIEEADGQQTVIPALDKSAKHADISHPHPFTYSDVHGHLWTLRIGHRLSRFLDFESSGKATSIPLTRFLEDREGNVWVGTEGTGLYRLQEQSVTVYASDSGLAGLKIYPILQDHLGDIWVGAWDSGLGHLSGRSSKGKFANYTPAQGLPSPLVTALGEDRDGNLWVGTDEGLCLFHDNRFTIPSGIVIPQHATAQAILQDRGGTMWIGTTDGLVLYRDGPSKRLTMQDGLATNDVRVILESGNGDIWIGGNGGLTRIHGAHLTRWTERDGLPSNSVRALYEDGSGVIWIGTYDGGLGRLKDGRFTVYTEGEGLYDQGVFQILDDGLGNFWMSSNRGIYRVSQKELNAYAEGKLSSVVSNAYGLADGMLNVECNGGMWPAGIRSREGTLWFPTQNGVAIIDPRKIRIAPQPPPVVIESVVLDHAQQPIDRVLVIPPGKHNLEIAYTALSFIHPRQIRFRYQLEGFDSTWVEASGRRTAYYSYLPPGSYHFKVIARGADGMWNNVGQSLEMEVLAPFYRTWWFILSETLAAAVLILLVVRYRLAQLSSAQAQQKEFSQQLIASQEIERQRIAAELHDSLGQRLVVINNLALFSLLARGKAAATEGEDAEALKEISSEASLAIQETREISYNLRPFQLERLGLTKALQGLARTVSAASGIPIRTEIEDIDDAFPEELRINLYRIVQESLNNITKHAQATEAEIRVIRHERQVHFRIRDNGIGLAATRSSSESGKTGFGLKGMAERANTLGGVFNATSKPGQGTAVTVEIPLGRARHG